MRKGCVNMVMAFVFLFMWGMQVYGQKGYLPYVHGESLTYVINYKWGAINTDVGEAVANLKYDDGMFHSVITGKT